MVISDDLLDEERNDVVEVDAVALAVDDVQSFFVQ